ncbi:hypothetical protein WA026_010888 [Henosepilachna vigintioctopunctata]|uniref:Uncharacterized protein n=1 Tax=Henosepilachna vigintioctopunctata TaxID=420089 RepID=A0AAW1UZG0_9CUCU
MSKIKAAVHLLIGINYVAAISYDVLYVHLPSPPDKIRNAFTGRLSFLTFWNMLLQGVFFTICFLNDVIGSNEPNPKKTPFIRRIKDLLFTSLAFPLSMFVGLTFWALFTIDRELVFPKVLDKYFPVWLNHIMHTNIMIFVILEMIISYRTYPSRKTGVSILSIFMLTYLIWIHVIYHYTGIWVYPVLTVLNAPMRLVFFVVLLFLILLMYLLGEKMNKIFWSNQIKAIETNKKKKKH